MFRTNRGCDADGFGPSGVGRPAVNHVCVKPNQRVDTCRQNLDQSYSLCLKPKSETVSIRLFHWLARHPGVGVFLVFGDKRQNQCLIVGLRYSQKGLVCCVVDKKDCFRLRNFTGKHYALQLCFFSVVCFLFLEVCGESMTVFFSFTLLCYIFALLFPLVFVSSPFWAGLPATQSLVDNIYVCCVFCDVFLYIFCMFVARFGCC